MSIVLPPTPANPSPAPSGRAKSGRVLTAVPNDEYFDRQPTSSANLPDARPLIENLAGGVLEVLAGARDLEQIARWMSEGVYKHLLRRVVLAQRGRDARRQPPGRPIYTISRMRVTFPADGIIEATVIIQGRARTRAVAMRLEGFDSRWRATALHVL